MSEPSLHKLLKDSVSPDSVSGLEKKAYEDLIGKIINMLPYMWELLKSTQTHSHVVCLIFLSLQTLKEAW